MRKYIALICLLHPFFVLSQQCSCEEKFRFIQKQMEHNYAGFPDKVTAKNKQAYEAYTAAYLQRIKKTDKPTHCFALITEWLKYFKDGHIQAYAAYNDSDNAALQERIKNTEKLSVPAPQLALLKNAKGIEGIYVHNDSGYTVAIVKSKTATRDYAGVIINSTSDMWQPGQVKMEMKAQKNGEYTVLLYMRDHSYRIQDWTFDGATLNNGEWIKKGTKKIMPNVKKEADLPAVSVKTLDNKTLYIQIGTFNEHNAKAIDSVFKASDSLLKSMPYLVLDLRGNGGGADFAYTPIIPYLYTDTIRSLGVDVLATPDNIKGWAKLLDNPDVPDETKKALAVLMDSMQAHPGEFVNSADDDTLALDTVMPYPQNIAILVDGDCASTTEQFLLLALQSKKVTLMGQHTYGALDYSNMRTVESPCNDIGLYYATTKSRRIIKGQGIDNVGIKPRFLLPKDKDWVEEARMYLEKK